MAAIERDNPSLKDVLPKDYGLPALDKTRLGRARENHHILKHPNGSMVVLPIHTGTLKVGILLDAIELAGISLEEFEELL